MLRSDIGGIYKVNWTEGLSTMVHFSRVKIGILKKDHQTTKFSSPPNFLLGYVVVSVLTVIGISVNMS